MPAIATHPAPSSRRATADRVIDVLLFATIFAGGFVFIEPSPYEGVFTLLAVACLFGSVRFDRKFLPLLVLLTFWILGSLSSLAPVVADESAVRFTAVTVYMALNAILYACIFCDDPLPRLRILRAAYIATGVVVSAFGTAAFFKLLPGIDWLLLFGRVRGTFKDPNVFGPFLIFPILLIVDAMVSRSARLLQLAALPILLLGLFLSFSRGAWGHFVASLILMFGFRVLTAPTPHERRRFLVMCCFAAAFLIFTTAFAILLGLGGEMLEMRAQLQHYDLAQGGTGRFSAHVEGLNLLLDSINGFGPMQYWKVVGQDAHQVYLNAISASGWLGGMAFIALAIATVTLGLRGIFITAPWQHFLIPALATYIGILLEGFVIDTDHWRHHLLLVGVIWGLSTLSLRERAALRRAHPALRHDFPAHPVAIRIVRGFAP